MSMIRFARAKTPREDRFWTASYDLFLDADDEIVDTTVTVTPDGLDIQAFIVSPDNRKVRLAVVGGVAPVQYKALVLAWTADGQKRELRLDVQVSEP
jgi:hypothetical protein